MTNVESTKGFPASYRCSSGEGFSMRAGQMKYRFFIGKELD
jgi:hypothetical protein